MVINEDLLFSHGAECEEFKTGQEIFVEDFYARYYYQISEGIVELKKL